MQESRRFVAGWFGATCGRFVAPVSYVSGVGYPRRPVVVGDGSNSAHFIYDPATRVEFDIDPEADTEQRDFVTLAKAAKGDHSGPLLLVDPDGHSLRAVVLHVADVGSTVRITAHPQDGSW